MSRLTSLVICCLAACATTPTNSTCPPTSRPTYDNFGRQFMTTYCTGCHSASAVDRHGAPGDQNYDTEAEIKRHADAIDGVAAAGPDATNAAMPDMSGPVHSQPSLAERDVLGQFLACEKGR